MDKDTGIMFVLMERLEKQRLPRLFFLKEKVDSSIKLNDQDLDFLEMALKDANKVMRLVSKHPEYQQLASKLIDLYNDITEKDLLLEKG